MPWSRRVASILLVVALGAAGSLQWSVAVAGTSWDPRVLPIAREVEQLRGLKFEHPVPVDFLSEAAFRKKVGAGGAKPSADEKKDIARAQGQLRAVGLLPANVDLLEAEGALRESGALAFYSPHTKRATVRGKALGPATRVTLAHELTHALQDQHFDLQKLQQTAHRKHASAALTALVEGDAVRVQKLYADKLSNADRAEYDETRSSGADNALEEARAAGVPDSLVILFDSPYTLGPLMLQLVEAASGEHAIDGLFRKPPTADSAYLTPSTLVDDSKLTKVAPPSLHAGERADGKPDVFGSFALFLVLAARSDPVDALAVADGWAGDAMVTFTRDDATCLRASFAGRSPAASAAIADALRGWVANGTPGAADVQQKGSLTEFTACAPDAADAPAQDGSFAALTVAAVRNALLAQLTVQGVGVDVAGCTANGVVSDPSFRPILDAAADDPNAEPDADLLAPFQQSVVKIATQCALER